MAKAKKASKATALPRWTRSEAQRMFREVSTAARSERAGVYAEWAKKRGIQGRSRMTKAQLQRALS